ncbi:MAG: class I SAM-dependent methyltransferase [Gammaproteobacteria bacterium]|nr:class I SAM-dependent methyltransferase [Gammaproteobacteria bacterium]
MKNITAETQDRNEQVYSGKLDIEAWFKVVDKDYEVLSEAVVWNNLFRPQTTLLDVGCGTGRFPELLRPYLPHQSHIVYDILDPSRFCLQECEKINAQPYFFRNRFHTTLDDAVLPQEEYDLIWAMHSLYNVNIELLEVVLGKLCRSLKKDGVGIIFIADPHSFCCSFYSKFIDIYDKKVPLWVNSDDIIAALQRLDIPFDIERKNFRHVINAENEYILATYLAKNSYEPLHSLSFWFDNNLMKAFLNQFFIKEEYVFPQHVSLIFFYP